MAFSGFLDGLGRWIGPQPKTPADLERQQAAADAADAAERARQAEARRPTSERITVAAGRILATLPAELRQVVLDTEAERARLEDRVSETQRALEAHLASEPDEDSLEDWLTVKARLEGQLPHLKRFLDRANQAHSAALTAARAALEGPAEEAYMNAARAYRRTVEENKAREKAAELDRTISDVARSRIRSLEAKDLG